jgi:putative aldouronate transport system substrate-binding protein
MSSKKKWLLPLTLTIATAMMLSGCGGNKESAGVNTATGDSASPKSSSEKPTEISIMSIYYQKEPPAADNAIIKELEKRTNTKLKITWVTPNSFTDKANVTLASGDLPDLMMVTDIGGSTYRNMAKQGAFWDLTEMIKDYPNLMAYPEITFTNNKIDGKLYGVPRVRPTEGNAQPLIRADWLEKVNMKLPETPDDLYNVMKAFKTSKPDGQKDTLGMSGYVNPNDMGQFGFIESTFTGANGKYKVVDAKLENVLYLPEMKQSLEWFQKVYKEGLIPQDFALLKHNQAKDLIFAGKAGIFPDKPNQGAPSNQQVIAINPEAKPDFVWIPFMSGSTGKFASKGNGHFGVFVISKKVPEDKVKKLLAFLDYGATDDGYELTNYGVKDVDFTKQGNNYELTDRAKNDPSFQFLQNIFSKYNKYVNVSTVGVTPAQIERDKKLIDQAAEVSVANSTDGLVSETATKLGSDYDKKIQDMKTKVIMSKASIADWDKFVSDLKADDNYQKIQDEFNAEYQKRASAK